MIKGASTVHASLDTAGSLSSNEGRHGLQFEVPGTTVSPVDIMPGLSLLREGFTYVNMYL